MNRRSLLDPAQLEDLERSLGPQTLAQTLDELIDTVPGRLEDLATAADRGDVGAWRRQLHALKGSCALAGAATMAAFCAEALGAVPAADPADVQRGLLSAWEPTRVALRARQRALRGQR
jgi:hypothetical protein